MSKKRTCIIILLLSFLFINTVVSENSISGNKDRSKVIIYNSTDIVKSVEGYAGPTPLKIYVERNRIKKVELLPNYETPKQLYFIQRSELLKRWNGMTLQQVINEDVDAVSGATYTSNAIIETVKELVYHILKTRKK